MSTAGRHIGPDRLRQHQPGVDGRRMEVHRHRPVGLPGAAPPPQRGDHACDPVVHGPGELRAAPQQLAPGRGAPRRRHRDLPDRDDGQQRPVRRRARWRCSPSGSGSGAPRDRATFLGVQDGLDRMSPKRTPAGPARLGSALRDDLGAGRRGRSGPQDHHRARVRPAARPRRRSDRRACSTGCPTSARTTSTRS